MHTAEVYQTVQGHSREQYARYYTNIVLPYVPRIGDTLRFGDAMPNVWNNNVSYIVYDTVTGWFRVMLDDVTYDKKANPGLFAFSCHTLESMGWKKG